MATYYSSLVSRSKTALNDVGVNPARRVEVGDFSVSVTFDATTALNVNDVIQMIPVDDGVTVYDVILSTEDLDTGTTIVLDVGDDGVTDRFIDGSTVGQAGGVARLNEHGGHGYTYATANTIDVLVQVGPTGGGVGEITVTAFMSREPRAT